MAENRHRFLTALGFGVDSFVASHQVHGLEILHAEQPIWADGYDAIVTNTQGLVVGVTVADCTPVLVYDPQNRVVAAIHAGWKGTAGKLVEKTLKSMAERYGTKPSSCLAYVGTCISECSFEVGEDVAANFPNEFKRFDEARGKFMVDLKKANKAQLLELGMPASQIEISPYCSFENEEDYFSHRRDKGLTGRMMGVIGLRE